MRAVLYGVLCASRTCSRSWGSMEVERVVARPGDPAFQARCTRCGTLAMVSADRFDPPARPDPRSTAAVVADAFADIPRAAPVHAGGELVEAGELQRRLQYQGLMAARDRAGRQKGKRR